MKAILKLLLLWGCAASAAAAQPGSPYPNKPVRLIVGVPPGGAADFTARIIAQKLAEGMGQNLVVENRGGAGGTIASDITAKATPDGYTLLWSSVTTHGVGPVLYAKLPYDAVKDFTHIGLAASLPMIAAVHVSVPAKSVKELIAYAKSKPGQINYGSAGGGSSSHLAVELFKSMAGIDMTHIPYKGTGPLITDMLSGQIGLTIASAVPLSPQVKAGKLRGLAVTSPRRSASFPDLPAIAETVPRYEVVNWFGIFAPAGTSKAIVARVNAELNKALQSSALVKTLNASGADATGGTPEDFTKLVKADFAKWAKVVKDSGARVD